MHPGTVSIILFFAALGVLAVIVGIGSRSESRKNSYMADCTAKGKEAKKVDRLAICYPKGVDITVFE